jgi:Xaa-Pro aminopeptidase
MNLTNIQAALKEEGIDCWVIYDFQGKNPIMGHFLQTKFMTTRRVFLVIPAGGEPTLLGSRVDYDTLQSFPYRKIFYVGWQEMESRLRELLTPARVIGMDYSPLCALPVVSRVDAGTVELLQSWGKQVVSAGNVFQSAAAAWSAPVLTAHLEDCRRVAAIKDEAFQFIADRLRSGQPVTEYDAQQFIMERFGQEGLWTPYPPVVAVNAHSGDPHYTPEADRHAPIQKGDWILIDLWAKQPDYQFVYADMTWVAFAGSTPSAKQQEVFEVVKGGRDKAIAFLQEQAGRQTPLEGWQVDDVTRGYIGQAGYGDYFIHRTGHSLSPGDHVHGAGVNIDNLETHDTRRLSPGIGFTIEPGIYLPEFGVRLEINVYMDESGPRITTPIQQEIIRLNV